MKEDTLVASWTQYDESGETAETIKVFEVDTEENDIRGLFGHPDGMRCTCSSCMNDYDCCGNWILRAMDIETIEIGSFKYKVATQLAVRNV